MNRRDFIKGIAAMVAAWLLPKSKRDASLARQIIEENDTEKVYIGKDFSLGAIDEVATDEGEYIVPEETASAMRAWLDRNTCPLEFTVQYGQCSPMPDPPNISNVPIISNGFFVVDHDTGDTWVTKDGGLTWNYEWDHTQIDEVNP